MRTLFVAALLAVSSPALADPAPKPPTDAQTIADLRAQIAQSVAVQNELYAELLAAQKDATVCKVGAAVGKK